MESGFRNLGNFFLGNGIRNTAQGIHAESIGLQTDACCSLFCPYHYRISFFFSGNGIWPVFNLKDDEETPTSFLTTKS